MTNELFNSLVDDYFEKRICVNELCIKYGLKKRAILYLMSKTGFTKQSYLREKYSEEYLTKELECMTFKQLSSKLNITLGELRVLLKYKNIKRDTSVFYKKNIVNPDFYNNKEFEKEFYYFVGLFVTDGCFSKNNLIISIKNKDSLELLTKLANIAGHNNIRSLKGGYNKLSFSCKKLKNKLIELGVPEKNKTYTLRDIYIPNSECLYSFLCGALDGDGHIGFQKSIYGYKVALDYTLCNYNYDFLINLQTKIKNLLGFDSVVQKHKSSIPALIIGARNKSEIFYKNMYHTSPLYLKCKYKIYLDVINKVMI